MPYDFSVSLAMVFFDIIILLNLTLNFGKLDRYHRAMRLTFLILSLSCVVDVAVGILSQSEARAGAFYLRLLLYAGHLAAFIAVAWYAVLFFMRMRTVRGSEQVTVYERAMRYVPIFVLLPLAGIYYYFHVIRPQLILFTFSVSILAYLFYFLSEQPLNDQLRERLTELSAVLKTAEEAGARARGEDVEKNEFLANMSHEIRTPLNSILGMNEMILRESGEENIIGYAHVIGSAGENLLAIINDILDFSRIESGDMQLNEAPYHLGRMLENVRNMISLRASDKGLFLHTDIDETLPDALSGDELRITQILTNLLSNAVKYTEQGSVTLCLHAKERSESSVLLEARIVDTGIGIREEDLPKLFESFVRFDEEKNKTIEGTGLGLAITQKLTHLMGGEIRVESVYRKGSAFTVVFPQKVTGSGTLRDYHREEDRESGGNRVHFTAPGARVLVVDDTKINLRVVEMLLKQTGIRVTTCLSGAESLKLLEEQTYDVILLDHMMPEMDGIETLHRIREMPQFDAARTKIIALTANAVAGAREEYLAAGFDDYLSKPIEPFRLEEMLQQYLPADKITSGARTSAGS